MKYFYLKIQNVTLITSKYNKHQTFFTIFNIFDYRILITSIFYTKSNVF
jgi:hypothetical protein